MDLFFFVNVFAGLRVVYNMRNAPYNRISVLKVLCTTCRDPLYELVNRRKRYRLVLPHSMISGSEGGILSTLPKSDVINTGEVPSPYCVKLARFDGYCYVTRERGLCSCSANHVASWAIPHHGATATRERIRVLLYGGNDTKLTRDWLSSRR